MGKPANSRCPECGTQADVQKNDKDHLGDKVVKATSEEVVLEIGCKKKGCGAVWRAVYAFAGNQ